MVLTTKNAENYIDKKLVGGLFHYYPLEVHKSKTGYFVIDRNGVIMPLNEGDEIYFEEAI